MPEKQDAGKPASKEDPAASAAGSAKSYVERVEAVAKWAVAGLAAVGAAAVTKLSLDRFGKGELEAKWVWWAYFGLGLFALGAVALVVAVIWQIRESRVTIGYLLSGRGSGRVNIPKKIENWFNANHYLLGGPTTLRAFRDRLNTLASMPRPLSDPDRQEFQRLKAARKTILETGANERARIVNWRVSLLTVIGALAATFGASTFALATNRDVVLREDRLAKEEREGAKIVAGEFLPKTPSPVLLVVPEANRGVVRLGRKCNLAGANAIVLEVASRPAGARPRDLGDDAVLHIVTERSDTCAVANLWVPPSWIASRPAAKASPSQAQATSGSDADDGAPSSTTSTPVETTVETTP